MCFCASYIFLPFKAVRRYWIPQVCSQRHWQLGIYLKKQLLYFLPNKMCPEKNSTGSFPLDSSSTYCGGLDLGPHICQGCHWATPSLFFLLLMRIVSVQTQSPMLSSPYKNGLRILHRTEDLSRPRHLLAALRMCIFFPPHILGTGSKTSLPCQKILILQNGTLL